MTDGRNGTTASTITVDMVWDHYKLAEAGRHSARQVTNTENLVTTSAHPAARDPTFLFGGHRKWSVQEKSHISATSPSGCRAFCTQHSCSCRECSTWWHSEWEYTCWSTTTCTTLNPNWCKNTHTSTNPKSWDQNAQWSCYTQTSLSTRLCTLIRHWIFQNPRELTLDWCFRRKKYLRTETYRWCQKNCHDFRVLKLSISSQTCHNTMNIVDHIYSRILYAFISCKKKKNLRKGLQAKTQC